MIEILNLQKTRRVERARFERLLRTLIRRYGVRKAAVTLSFVGDAAIRRLNRKFRKKDKPTDVLSFPIMKPGPDGHFHLGDIIISVPARGGPGQGPRPQPALRAAIPDHPRLSPPARIRTSPRP